MFTTEQHIAKKISKTAVKHFFKDGTSFAKSRIVSRRFTYREFTLVVGILVALLVALTVWVSRKDISLAKDTTQTIQSVTVPTLAELVEHSISTIIY